MQLAKMPKGKCAACGHWYLGSELRNGRTGTIWEKNRVCYKCDCPGKIARVEMDVDEEGQAEAPDVPDMDVEVSTNSSFRYFINNAKHILDAYACTSNFCIDCTI